MINLKLYIGAHKTATTHINNLLDSSRSVLVANGIKLSLPNEVRCEWLPNFFNFLSTKNPRALEKIKSLSPTLETWILCEENISGLTQDFSRREGIYPSLKRRMEAIKAFYPEVNIEVFFSIRSYDLFYGSAYLEAVRCDGYSPFMKFYDEDRFKNNSWVTVADSLSKVFSEEKITLWCYEDFSSVLLQVIEKITGLNSEISNQIITDYGNSITRPSMSKRALTHLACLSSAPISIQKKSIEKLIDKYPANAENGYFRAFDKQKSTLLKKKYVEDIETIKNLYPKINFICK